MFIYISIFIIKNLLILFYFCFKIFYLLKMLRTSTSGHMNNNPPSQSKNITQETKLLKKYNPLTKNDNKYVKKQTQNLESAFQNNNNISYFLNNNTNNNSTKSDDFKTAKYE